ncbi:MAG: protein kinase [Planctomycetaceae bacterium]
MKFTYAPESRPLDGFTIKRAVHRGHFGEVYFAISDAGKEVALKLLRQDVDVELRGVTQCLNLKHPHLVTIFDIKQDDDGDHWIVMEYVSGQRLDQMIDEYPRGMPMEKVLAWLNGLTDGLTYMHNSGVVHRDLKPANLFWDHGHVKIGDVGLSKIISPSKKSAQTQSVGTVYYMAPEVAHGRYGRTVDVYSMGVILVEMLTGQLPFEGETVAEILFKHLTGAPDLSRCPAPVQGVLARALEKDPEKRIASVEELRSAFEHAVKTGKAEPYISSNPSTDHVSFGKDVEKYKTKFRDDVEKAKANFEKKIDAVREEWNAYSFLDRDADDDKRSPVLNQELASELERRVERERHQHADRHDGHNHQPVFGPLLLIPLIFFGIIFLMRGIRFVGAGSSFPSWIMLFMIAGGVYFAWRRFRPSSYRSYPPRHRAYRPAPVAHRGAVDELEVVDESTTRPLAVARGTSAAPLPKIPLSHRVQHVAWEMVLSVLCTGLLTAGLAVVSSQFGVSVPFHETIHTAQGELVGLSTEWDPGMVGFFAAVTILSVWGLLLPVRLGEWRNWDGGTCRLVSGVVGIMVGTAAYLLDLWLLIPLRLSEGGSLSYVTPMFDHLGRQSLFDFHREPTWFGYALFFFMLFALVRWWKQGTSFRPKRFRTWAVFTTAFLAFLISGFWAFPMNWAMTWAAVISSVVQLSSLSYGRSLPPVVKKKVVRG